MCIMGWVKNGYMIYSNLRVEQLMLPFDWLEVKQLLLGVCSRGFFFKGYSIDRWWHLDLQSYSQWGCLGIWIFSHVQKTRLSISLAMRPPFPTPSTRSYELRCVITNISHGHWLVSQKSRMGQQWTGLYVHIYTYIHIFIYLWSHTKNLF